MLKELAMININILLVLAILETIVCKQMIIIE